MSAPTPHFYDRLSSLLWRIIVLGIVLLAVYVSLGRLFSSHVDRYRQPIVDGINHAIPGRLEADRIALRWDSFSPTLILSEVVLHGDSGAIAGTTVAFETAELSVDVLTSLRLWVPSISSLTVKGLNVEYKATDVTGEAEPSATNKQSLTFLGDLLEVLMDKTRRLDFADANLSVHRADQRYLATLNFDYWRDASERQLKIQIQDSAGTDIELIAQGLGNPLRPEEFSGTGYASLAITQEPLFLLTGMTPMPAQRDAGLELSVYLQALPRDWRLGGRWSLSGLKLQSQETAHQVSGDLRIDTNFQTTRAQFFNQGIESSNDPVSLPEVRTYWRDNALLIATEHVEIAEFSRLLGEVAPSSAFTSALTELEPQGRVAQMRALWRLKQKVLQAHVILDDLGVKASEVRAGAQGVSGDLWIQRNKAWLQLNSPQLDLDLPTVYAEPLRINSAQADVYAYWNADVLHLRTDNIQGVAAVGHTHGKLALKLPLKKGDIAPEMELYLGVSQGDTAARNTVIPSTISESLQSWLDTAIADTRASDLGFVYRGSLLKEEREARSLGLIGRIDTARLKFLPDWPELGIDSAVFNMDDEQTGIWLEQGGLPGIKAKSVGAEVWLDADRQPHLTIDGFIEGQLARVLDDLRDSPLAIYVPEAIADWKTVGTVAGRLQLKTPLIGAVRPRVDLSLNLNQVGMIPLPGLAIQGLGGDLQYSTETGFSANSLTGSVWNQPLAARVVTKLTEVPTTEIQFSTALNGPLFEEFLGLGIQGRLFGKSELYGSLLLSSEQANLQITSDLRGIKIDLPKPLTKPEESSLPLHFDLDLRSEELKGDLKLGQNLNLSAQFAPSKRGFAVGFERNPLPLEAGLSSVTGSLQSLDLDAWQSVLLQSQESSLTHYLVQDLRVGQLRFMQREVDSVLLMAERKGSDWFVGWQLDWLKGELSSKESGSVWNLHVLDIDLERIPSGWLEANDSARDVGSQWPELRVTADQIRRGDDIQGRGEFSVVRSDTSYQLTFTRGDWRRLRVDPNKPIVLVWPTQGLITSRLTGGILVDNLGDVFEAYGYESVLKTRSGEADFDLTWPGGPEVFGFAGTDGQLNIRLSEGKFLKASAGAQGALKVITILNFADIVSRLSLTRLFESGVPFDQLVVEARADLGLINVDQLNMETSASRFQFSGQANLLDESLDGRLIATLPVASNLPWLAALTGGLPAAAGVYVISKIFEKQVDKFSSAVYSVKGTWQEPDLKFDKLFDTKLPKPKSQSASEEQEGSTTEARDGAAGESSTEGDSSGSQSKSQVEPNLNASQGNG